MDRRTFLRSVIVGTLTAPFVTRQVKASEPVFWITVRDRMINARLTNWDVHVRQLPNLRESGIGSSVRIGYSDNRELIAAKCVNVRASIMAYALEIGYPTHGLDAQLIEAMRVIR